MNLPFSSVIKRPKSLKLRWLEIIHVAARQGVVAVHAVVVVVADVVPDAAVAVDVVAMMAHVEVVDTTAPAVEAGRDTEILPHLKSRGLPVAALKN